MMAAEVRENMEQLFKNYGKWELKENKKENENYEKMIEKVISELLNSDK